MALLVIVCGALLVVGGAISLLMGFDIVMTERGSAMTLGGIIALSGGVIAVGIGFALLRLSQILAALQERNVRGVRPVVTPDRPVVPLAPPEPVVQADMPPPVLAEPGASRVGIGTGVVVAGIAATAAVVAAGYSSAATGPETPASGAGPSPGHAAVDEAVTATPGMNEPPPLDIASVVAASPSPHGSIPDLEEELARALAEPGSAPPPFAARDKIFSDGLSDLLAKPRSRKRKQETDQEAGLEAEMSPEAEGKSAPDEETPYGEPPLPAYVTETTDGAAETEESIVVPDLPDLPDAPVEMREPVPEEVVVDAIAAAPELAVATPSVTTHPAVDPNENERMVASLASPVVPSKKVLGTYNAGGRTYSMYADGSVEAATESGVERFSSMDELRRHLVKT